MLNLILNADFIAGHHIVRDKVSNHWFSFASNRQFFHRPIVELFLVGIRSFANFMVSYDIFVGFVIFSAGLKINQTTSILCHL